MERLDLTYLYLSSSNPDLSFLSSASFITRSRHSNLVNGHLNSFLSRHQLLVDLSQFSHQSRSILIIRFSRPGLYTSILLAKYYKRISHNCSRNRRHEETLISIWNSPTGSCVVLSLFAVRLKHHGFPAFISSRDLLSLHRQRFTLHLSSPLLIPQYLAGC